MAESGPLDDSDQHEVTRSSRRHQRSLRVNHLDNSPRRPGTSRRRSKMSSDIDEKLHHMTSSLRASSEVLSTADRMLDHYRCINEDQDEEIQRLRAELDSSTELMRERRNRQKNGRWSQVRFADQSSPKPSDDLHVSLRSLESEQRRLADEISRDRDERARIDADNRRTVRKLEESFQRVEDDIQSSWSERERNRRSREEHDVIGRRQEEGIDRELLSESVKLTLDKEREIKELRDQLRESQRRESHDKELEDKVRRIYDQEHSAAKGKKEVETLIEELRSVKDLMNGSASEKRVKEQLTRIRDEEYEIERSERERRLSKKIQMLEDKLEDTEQERRKIEQDLESVVKRLEWSDAGRNSLVKQIDELNRELKNASEEKTFISSSLRDCKAKLEESEVLRDRLTSRLDSLCKKYENEEEERESLQQQLERLNEKLRDKSRELAEKTEYAKKQEKIVAESEMKKEELKNRALETIKDYKIKLKRCEKDMERHKDDAAALKDELRKVRRNTDEGSSKFLALEEELRSITIDRDRLKEELDKRAKQVNTEIRNSTQRLNSALDENVNLEKELASLKEENERLSERNQTIERKCAEETARLNKELSELKEGIRDMFGKKSRLEVKLKEEQLLHEELLNSVTKAKEEQAKAKEEVASLYRQLQQERDECNMNVKDVEEKMQELRDQSAKEAQETEKRLQKQREEFDEKFGEIKLQLADERATVKALRNQQEKDGRDFENTRAEFIRLTEERNRLRQKQEEMMQEADTKDEMRERDKARISELETEVRRCHRSLNRVTDEQKDGFQKVNEAIQELIEKFCQEKSLSQPSTSTNKSFLDAQSWASEATAKLKWLEDDIQERLQNEHGYRDKLDSYRGKVKDVVNKADADKAHLMSELDKRNILLKELAREKKELEEKGRENQDTITSLQKKIDKLTKYLDTSTKALQKSIGALEDTQRVVDEFDSLRGDQEERDRVRNKHARYQERVVLLKRELTDAKTQAEDLKQDTKDASNLSARLLESLNQLPSPGFSETRNKDSLMSVLSRSQRKEGYLSSSSESLSPLNEDHNFKTPDKVSLRDLKHKSRSPRRITRNTSRVKPEKD